jgi:MoaA/NifB/PqqE/SkfB family radical SAM enzyme
MPKFASEMRSDRALTMTRMVHAMVGVRAVRLEVSSKCQLKCPLCPTGTGTNRKGPVGWGHLSAENFRKFIALNPKVRWIELSNYGEIFLNPEFATILSIANEAKVQVSALNGVNLNNCTPEALEAVVKYKLRGMTLSIDGASQETYSIYRIGGNFDRVIENVRTLNRFKKQYNSIFPYLRWQFVVFGHNEHELEKARMMAEELGASFHPKMNWNLTYSPPKNLDKISSNVGRDLSSAEKIQEQSDADNHTYGFCGQLWRTPQINWDGKVLGCCVNVWGDFGNAFEQPLHTLLKEEPYANAKAMLLGKKAPSKDIPCWNCPTYKRSAGLDSVGGNVPVKTS